MKPLRLVLLPLLLVLGFTGCLQVEKIVKLKPDGRGTIVETVVVSKAWLGGFEKAAGALAGGKDSGGKAPDLFDEAKLKEDAAKMGEGVTFVSSEKISNDEGEGFTATYAFTDVNKLTIDENPGGALPQSHSPKAEVPKKEPIVFHFTKGSPAELTLTMPPPDFRPKKEPPAGVEDMIMQAMQHTLKDMRVSMAVEVEGKIVETNASYHDGSRVTLMELDFNKVMADPEKFKALASANPQSLEEAKALLKGLDGVKIEMAAKVEIKFE
jgi:hypothetical protein